MSSYPPPPDAPDVLPGEDGGDYAARKAEDAAVADAQRLPEWVLLAEVARRQRHGRAAPDDAALLALAERLQEAFRKAFADGCFTSAERWLRVASEARAAIGVPDSAIRLATEGDAMRDLAAYAVEGARGGYLAALRAILAVPRACRSCGGTVEPARQCYAIPTCYACLPPPPALETIEVLR